jgi:DNA repair protein RadC
MKIPINQWSAEDRPREKLLKKGVSSLTNAELIAILIGSGSKEESAVDLSKRILHSASDNLEELGRFSINDLMKFKGIGEAKAISIVAMLELGRRRNLAQALETKTIKSSKDAFQILAPILSDKKMEEFRVICLRKNTILGQEKLSQGGLDASIVDIRLLMKLLLEKEATSFIIAHNHPSGNINPSQSDIQLTQKINEASSLLNLQLLDHLIIGKNKYYSFADEGRL